MADVNAVIFDPETVPDLDVAPSIIEPPITVEAGPVDVSDEAGPVADSDEARPAQLECCSAWPRLGSSQRRSLISLSNHAPPPPTTHHTNL